MHPSVHAFAAGALTGEQVAGKHLVEVGARDYNGSVREAYEAMRPASYLGTDVQPGPGVDLLCPAGKLPGLRGASSADIVICTEMLEHAEDWRAAVMGMARILAPGGFLVLTTRSPGFPYHPHPGDFWRFTPDVMDGIAEACGLDVLRLEPDGPQTPGVFLLARKPRGWDGIGMAEGLAVISPGPPR